MKTRNFCLLLYPDEDPSHLSAMQVLRSSGMSYCAVEHNADVTADGELKKPHTHVVLMFENARSFNGVAKLLGIEVNYVQHCYDVRSALRYLVHADDSEKFQYDPSIVEGSPPGLAEFASALSCTAVINDSYAFRVIKNYLDENRSYVKLSELSEFAYEKSVTKFFVQRFAFYSSLLREHNDIFNYSKKEQ